MCFAVPLNDSFVFTSKIIKRNLETKIWFIIVISLLQLSAIQQDLQDHKLLSSKLQQDCTDITQHVSSWAKQQKYVNSVSQLGGTVE